MSNIEEVQKQIGNERLVNLLRAIDLEMAQTDEDHVADDESLIEKWAAGLLTVDEHELVLKHLAGCHECSQFFHDMTGAGIFERAGRAAETNVVSADSAVVPTPTLIRSEQPTTSRTGRQSWIVVTTAACALIAVAGYMATRSGGGGLLLAQGDFGRITHYLNEAEFATVAAGSYAKAGGVPIAVRPDVNRDRQLDRLPDQISRNPSDTTLRLNYGQLLLEAGRPEDAIREFEFAAVTAPDNHFALLGLGLAQFRAKQTVDAESTFARIPDDSPVTISAKLNQIVCLIALDRKDRARELWQLIPEGSRTEKLRRVLDAGMVPE